MCFFLQEMALRGALFLGVLFITVFGSDIINCSQKSPCFGEPENCDVYTNCTIVVKFYTDASFHVYLRNFTDFYGYVKIQADYNSDNDLENYVCIPHFAREIHALKLFDGTDMIPDRDPLYETEKLDEDYFRCFFHITNLPRRFNPETSFKMSIGTFNEDHPAYGKPQLYTLETHTIPEEEDETRVNRIVGVDEDVSRSRSAWTADFIRWRGRKEEEDTQLHDSKRKQLQKSSETGDGKRRRKNELSEEDRFFIVFMVYFTIMIMIMVIGNLDFEA
uniref:DOMON domain-containing protein n=1 Tax=Caenorhabditis tropicalis TaxID=1561998 RepID=A0A1I7TN71_9PELO